MSIGAMVGPDAFEEVRYLAHARHLQALERIPEIADDFASAFGRTSGGLLHTYRTEDADTVVVALGSVLGTIKDLVDVMRDEGTRIGVLGITSFRPFPAAAVRSALQGAARVVVVEKAFSVGFGGVLSTDIAMAVSGLALPVHTVVAGLGGRPVTGAGLRSVLQGASDGNAETLTFLELDRGIVDRELARMAAHRHSGPTAENVLRDLGTVPVPGG
jgi:pyruvate ferredoxin oxidoreductase alpha subunit